MVLGNFYSKRSKCFALDGYRAKKKRKRKLSRNISPVCSSFVLVIASDMHLESESEKRAKNVDLHTAKNIQIQPNTFSLFLDEFLETYLRPIYCSLTCWAKGGQVFTRVVVLVWCFSRLLWKKVGVDGRSPRAVHAAQWSGPQVWFPPQFCLTFAGTPHFTEKVMDMMRMTHFMISLLGTFRGPRSLKSRMDQSLMQQWNRGVQKIVTEIPKPLDFPIIDGFDASYPCRHSFLAEEW